VTSTIDASETTLSELLLKVQAGDTVIITSGDEKKPVARLEAVALPVDAPIRLGALKHLNLDIPDSFFFDPLPEAELGAWEGHQG